MRKFFIIVLFIVCFVVVGLCKYDQIEFPSFELANPKYYFFVDF